MTNIIKLLNFITSNLLRVYTLFTFRKIKVIVITCLVLFCIKYILMYFGFDYQNVIDHPFISFSCLLTIGFIRHIVRAIIEEYIFPQYLTMEGSQGGNAGNAQPNNAGNTQQSNAGNTQQNNNTNVIYHGEGFTCINGVYTVDDPTNVTANPFINPATNERYATYKPYSTYFKNALSHAVAGGSPAQVINYGKFGPNEIRFFDEFMESTYPNRYPSAYLNSRPVRKALGELP